MVGGKRGWIRDNLGTFLQQYQRKAQRGVEPNDRQYDRNLEAKLKRMKAEDLGRLMTDDDDSAGAQSDLAPSVAKLAKARVIAEIPMDRVDFASGDDAARPAIGDIVELDHGFMGLNGEPMGIVICFNEDRSVRWAADVMDSEIEVLP